MKLCLGSAQFGSNYGIANEKGMVSEKNAKAILDLAKSKNIKLIDTAVAYGDSEVFLGEAGVNDFDVVSKIPKLELGSKSCSSWTEDHIYGSLKRLQVERLYAMLVHDANDLTGPHAEDVYSALVSARDEGLIKKIGVSIYHPSQLMDIFEKFKIDIVQAPANLLDTRLFESTVLSYLNDTKVELHVRSVFLQGLLLMDEFRRPNKFNKWKNLWDCLDKLVIDLNLSMKEMCIRYIASIYPNAVMVVGLDNLAQMSEILDLVNLSPFSRRELQHISTEIETATAGVQNMAQLINPADWDKVC